MNDYKKDLEICEAATPGPWEYKEVDYYYFAMMQGIDDAETGEKENAQYIAHFNPFKCREMVETIQTLETKCEDQDKKIEIFDKSLMWLKKAILIDINFGLEDIPVVVVDSNFPELAHAIKLFIESEYKNRPLDELGS